MRNLLIAGMVLVCACYAARGDDKHLPPPKYLLFQGKLVSCGFGTDSSPDKAVKPCNIMYQFLVEKTYGVCVWFTLQKGPGTLIALRSGRTFDPSQLTSENYNEMLKSLLPTNAHMGQSFLIQCVNTIRADQLTIDEMVPFTPDAEKAFVAKYAKPIEHSIIWIKDCNRKTRANQIQVYQRCIETSRSWLREAGAERRAAIEEQIRKDEIKLKQLLESPEDEYPPAAWKESPTTQRASPTPGQPAPGQQASHMNQQRSQEQK
ncbi:MAG: hypothetical protein ACM359_15090 [Bacillota bacterium]